MTIPPGFRKFPQPPDRKPMTVAEHKEQMDWTRQDIDAGDDLLHEILCVIYATPDAQNS